eukprot:765247-Hanusia_phi.AAC.3
MAAPRRGAGCPRGRREERWAGRGARSRRGARSTPSSSSCMRKILSWSCKAGHGKPELESQGAGAGQVADT